MMDDTYLDTLLDMLTFLEMGHEIKPTSVLHDELMDFMLSNGFATDDSIAKRRAEFIDDGIEERTQ